MPIQAGRDGATAQFRIAVRLACTASANVTVTLDLTGTAPAGVESASRSLALTGSAAHPPTISPISAEFNHVDLAGEDRHSRGTIQLRYADASAACGWRFMLTIGDFSSAAGVIPAEGAAITSAEGVQGIWWSGEGPGHTVHVPGAADGASKGTLTLTISVPIPDGIEEGEYATTITITPGAP